jgi:hypothetical protein
MSFITHIFRERACQGYTAGVTSTPLQVGRYAEYLIKMELVLPGFYVYAPEVDDGYFSTQPLETA